MFVLVLNGELRNIELDFADFKIIGDSKVYIKMEQREELLNMGRNKVVESNLNDSLMKLNKNNLSLIKVEWILNIIH